MPQVHYVKKAAKAHKTIGVKKGEPYYWWKTRRKGRHAGVKHKSKTRPRPSQLTMSDYLTSAYLIKEGIEEAQKVVTCVGDVAGFVEALKAAADECRALGDEQEEKRSNMPESLQNGPIGELMEERANRCGSVADELEAAADELEGYDPNEDKDREADTTDDDAIGNAIDGAMQGVSWEFD